MPESREITLSEEDNEVVTGAIANLRTLVDVHLTAAHTAMAESDYELSTHHIAASGMLVDQLGMMLTEHLTNGTCSSFPCKKAEKVKAIGREAVTPAMEDHADELIRVVQSLVITR